MQKNTNRLFSRIPNIKSRVRWNFHKVQFNNVTLGLEGVTGTVHSYQHIMSQVRRISELSTFYYFNAIFIRNVTKVDVK